MVLIGAACAAGVTLGLLAIVLGIRGVPAKSRPVRERSGSSKLQRTALALAAGVVVWGLTAWPVAGLLAALGGWVGPETLKRTRGPLDDAERAEAIAAWTELIRDTLAAAAGLEEAILASADAAPEQIRTEVSLLARRLKRDSLVDALDRFAQDVANPAADLVVAALVTAARREARDLVPLLSALARSTRAEANMRRRIDVGRARIRTSVRVVVGTLALFAIGLLVFNRAYLEPYSTPTGQVVLVFVGAFFAGGWALLQRMSHIEGPGRFLTGKPASDRSGA